MGHHAAVPFSDNTTWTIGRILDRLHEVGEEVVVYAGHHAHRGYIRGVGEYLLTLQCGSDMLAVSMASVSSVQLLDGALRPGSDADAPPARPAGGPRSGAPEVPGEGAREPATGQAPYDAASDPAAEDPRAKGERHAAELRDWLRRLQEEPDPV